MRSSSPRTLAPKARPARVSTEGQFSPSSDFPRTILTPISPLRFRLYSLKGRHVQMISIGMSFCHRGAPSSIRPLLIAFLICRRCHRYRSLPRYCQRAPTRWTRRSLDRYVPVKRTQSTPFCADDPFPWQVTLSVDFPLRALPKRSLTFCRPRTGYRFALLCCHGLAR